MNFKRDICILTQQDLMDAGCFDMEAAVHVAEEALVAYADGDVIYPDKVAMVFDQTTQDRINCLPAGFHSKKVYGMKWVSVFPNNPHSRNLPNLSAAILLSEIESGFPIVFMEGTMCSNMRTAAVSAVAAKYLAVDFPKSIGFIGCGEQAKSHFLSMKAVFPSIKVCRISSRTETSEQKFEEQIHRFAPDVEFIRCKNNYRRAVEDCDIIVTAISGQEKILQADWIKTGAFYCHVGGLEDDFGVAMKADKIVTDHWASVKHRTQTISQMYQRGLLSDEDIHADLYEIVTGKKPGRENNREFTYYNGVGLSYVDIALSYWMYQKAVEKGVGTKVVMQDRSMFDLQVRNAEER